VTAAQPGHVQQSPERPSIGEDTWSPGRTYGGNTNQSFRLTSQADGSTGIRSMYHWVGPS
jgi:hypothetical protein